MKSNMISFVSPRQKIAIKKLYNRVFQGHPKRVGVFISIPKNASNSIRELLGMGENRDLDDTDSNIIHENHQRAMVLMQRYHLENLFVFCFSRNPYSRTASWYQYHKSKGFKPYTEIPFNQWVMGGMPHHVEQQNLTDWTQEKLTPLLQYNYVEGCDIDFIGRVENFEEDIQTVIHKLNAQCVKIGEKPDFKNTDLNVHLNQNENKQTPIYTPELKERVYSMLKKDFDYFGYPK